MRLKILATSQNSELHLWILDFKPAVNTFRFPATSDHFFSSSQLMMPQKFWGLVKGNFPLR